MVGDRSIPHITRSIPHSSFLSILLSLVRPSLNVSLISRFNLFRSTARLILFDVVKATLMAAASRPCLYTTETYFPGARLPLLSIRPISRDEQMIKFSRSAISSLKSQPAGLLFVADSQTPTTLCSPPGQHFPSRLAPHLRAETVGPFLRRVVRLKRSFHQDSNKFIIC